MKCLAVLTQCASVTDRQPDSFHRDVVIEMKLCVGLDNRWLVTFNSAEAKEHLLRHGLSLFNKKIKLRSYDDVLNDEYMEYLEYEQLQKSLYARREQLEASDTGDASLDDGASNDQAQQDIEIEDHSDPVHRPIWLSDTARRRDEGPQ